MSVRSPVSASIMRSATVAIALLAFVSSAFPARADMVTDWNVIALDTIPATISGPPHARLMGYVQAAVFDLAPIPDGDAKTAGTDLGRTVAEQLYTLSLKDGA